MLDGCQQMAHFTVSIGFPIGSYGVQQISTGRLEFFLSLTILKLFLMRSSLKHSYDTQEYWKNKAGRERYKKSFHFVIFVT